MEAGFKRIKIFPVLRNITGAVVFGLFSTAPKD